VTMAAILVAPLFIAYDSLNSMRSAVQDVQEKDLNATLLLARIRTSAEELRQAELQLAYAGDSANPERSEARVMAAVGTLRIRSDSLEHFELADAQAEIDTTLARIEAALPAEFDAVRRHQGERADSLSKLLQPVMLRVDSVVEGAGTFLQGRTATPPARVRRRRRARRADCHLAHDDDQSASSRPRERDGGRRQRRLLLSPID
jgi:hypothetical protein